MLSSWLYEQKDALVSLNCFSPTFFFSDRLFSNYHTLWLSVDWLFHTIWIKCLLSIRCTEFPYALVVSTAISSLEPVELLAVLSKPSPSAHQTSQLKGQRDPNRDDKMAGSWNSLGDEQHSATALDFQGAEWGRVHTADNSKMGWNDLTKAKLFRWQLLDNFSWVCQRTGELLAQLVMDIWLLSAALLMPIFPSILWDVGEGTRAIIHIWGLAVVIRRPLQPWIICFPQFPQPIRCEKLDKDL